MTVPSRKDQAIKNIMKTRKNKNKNDLKFPKCTEKFIECNGRTEPCLTCPYK